MTRLTLNSLQRLRVGHTLGYTEEHYCTLLLKNNNIQHVNNTVITRYPAKILAGRRIMGMDALISDRQVIGSNCTAHLQL